MSFTMMKQVVSYGRQRAAERGTSIEFSLTTNATLLSSTIIEFLAEHGIGVTVSMDGPKVMQGKFRIFANGKGSYDIMKPKLEELITKHRQRPRGARGTFTPGATHGKRTAA